MGVKGLLKKIVSLLAAAVLLLCPMAVAEEADWMVFASRTEALYSEVQAAYALPVYAGENTDAPAALQLATGETGEAVITVPEDGLYELWVTYQNLGQSSLPTEMMVSVDGQLPFYEMRRIKLYSLWLDDGIFPTDRYGNEVAPTPYAANQAQTVGLTDSAGRIDVPFLFALTAGEHTIGFEVLDGFIRIDGLSLRAPETVAAYQGGDASGDNLIVIEAEKIKSRNDSSIRGAGEFNAVLSPYDVDDRKINYLDGTSFDAAGDTVTYSVNVEESGWYQLGFFYRQSAKADFPVFVDVLIDGALPSEAARMIPFDYATGFTAKTVAAGGRRASTSFPCASTARCSPRYMRPSIGCSARSTAFRWRWYALPAASPPTSTAITTCSPTFPIWWGS